MMYWLHYVGARLYSTRRFEAEARRYGVSRAVPCRLLGSFRFGDVVLLAQHVKAEDKRYALVFGYFTVEGVLLPQEEAGVLRHLRVRRCWDTGDFVLRACGSYTETGGCTVDDDLPRIAGLVKCKGKTFLTGRFSKLAKPLLIEGEPFFRGYKRVELDFPLEAGGGERAVVFYRDYKQRRYLSRRALSALESRLLEDYTA